MILSYYKKLGEIVSDSKWFYSNIFETVESGIEIVLSDPSVYRSLKTSDLKTLKGKLKQAKVSAHLPFYDLNFFSPDPSVSKYSTETVIEAIFVSSILGATVAVAHINLNPFLPEKAFLKWFKGFIEAKNIIEKKAADIGIRIVWENTYEKNFRVFDMMKEENDATLFCLDAGHCNCFGEFTPVDFIKRYGRSIRHLHIHDNRGDEDSHLVPGEGNIDFEAIMSSIDETGIETIVFEIEEESALKNGDKIKEIFSGGNINE